MTARVNPLPGSAFQPNPAERRLTAGGSLGVIVVALAAILAAAIPGCSSGAGYSVEPDRALAVVTAALDAWRQGQSLQSFEDAGTATVVREPDWSSGARLTGYQLLDDGEPADANLKISARLTLETKGKPVEKTVRYLVTTSPAVTVCRDIGW